MVAAKINELKPHGLAVTMGTVLFASKPVAMLEISNYPYKGPSLLWPYMGL
jgi:hypothetical protein